MFVRGQLCPFGLAMCAYMSLSGHVVQVGFFSRRKFVFVVVECERRKFGRTHYMPVFFWFCVQSSLYGQKEAHCTREEVSGGFKDGQEKHRALSFWRRRSALALQCLE